MSGAVLPFRVPPSRQEALARVRDGARNTGNILWTDHVRERMEERDVTGRQALRTIREGNIDGKIVPDGEDEWKLTLKKRDAGRTVHVVVALSDREELTVITVY